MHAKKTSLNNFISRVHRKTTGQDSCIAFRVMLLQETLRYSAGWIKLNRLWLILARIRSTSPSACGFQWLVERCFSGAPTSTNRWYPWRSRVPLRLTARRSWVRFPLGDDVGAGGVSHTLRRRRPHPRRWGWPKGLSVWSLHVLPVSPWVRTTCPHKNMQRVKSKMGYKNVGSKNIISKNNNNEDKISWQDKEHRRFYSY